MSEIKNAAIFRGVQIENALKNVTIVINKIHKKHFITDLDIVFPNEFQAITNSLLLTLRQTFSFHQSEVRLFFCKSVF